MASVNHAAPITEVKSFWQSPLRGRDAVVGFALTFGLTCWLVYSGHFGLSFAGVSDSDRYLLMAGGDDTVGQPFASRQLGPLIARGTMALLHCPVERAFVIQGTICLFVLLAVVFKLLSHTRAPRWLIPAMAIVPFLGELYLTFALPDMLYAALLSVFLLFLLQQRFLFAAGMMFPLVLARESTILTLACFLIANWAVLRWKGRLLAVFASGAGMAVVHHLTAHSVGNVEKLPAGLYMLAKAPFNFLRSMGVLPWSNAMPLCEVPFWQHGLPFHKHIGAVEAVGVCGFSSQHLLQWMTAAGVTFGLLPLLTAMLWWKSRRVKTNSALLRFSLLYGGLCFVMAPMLGVWYLRLFGYAWPLFFVALPLLFDRFDNTLRTIPLRCSIPLLVIHYELCFLPHMQSATFVASSVALLYVAGGLLLLLIIRQSKLTTAAEEG